MGAIRLVVLRGFSRDGSPAPKRSVSPEEGDLIRATDRAGVPARVLPGRGSWSSLRPGLMQNSRFNGPPTWA